jgi:CelD/BcsL family acetyltransferase involved in cellulose biosynthesis
LNLELITTLEGFEALQSEWNLLLPHNATNEIFLTWEWQTTWWWAYQPGSLWIVAARDERGILVGIAPWFIEQPDRVVRTIGCEEVTDYLDVLAAPATCAAFYVALADFLVAHSADYSRIDLCNILVGTPTLDAMPRLLTERGFAVEIKQEDVSPFIPLPEDFEGYLDQLDKKQRHELRRKMRRAENTEDETIAWYMVGPQHDLAAETEKFLRLMAASQPLKAQFLQEAGHRRFFPAIIRRLAECGWLQLSFLTVDGDPAATYLNFDFDNRILVYNSGIVPEKYAHLSPGIVLLCYNIRHAIEQGRTVFDFLQGNEEYKYRMGAQDRAVMMLEAVCQDSE